VPLGKQNNMTIQATAIAKGKNVPWRLANKQLLQRLKTYRFKEAIGELLNK